MNVLNLTAVFGILVFVFQDGRLEGLLDYRSQGALEQTMPILLFALAFGLSTDYGVFLLSRIKEARDAGASDSECVAIGLERTGRIVTAAAVLFAIAVGVFATSQIVFIKENFIGVALAVLIDASIIRALLVPGADGAAGPLELVGAEAAAPLALAHRPQRDQPRVGAPIEAPWLGDCVRGWRLSLCSRLDDHRNGNVPDRGRRDPALRDHCRGRRHQHPDGRPDPDDRGRRGLALSLLYELVQQGGKEKEQRDEYPQQRGGYDDPTRRMR